MAVEIPFWYIIFINDIILGSTLLFNIGLGPYYFILFLV
jgi:hypothetical protein